MPWEVLVGVVAVVAVTAIYFLWARKLGAPAPTPAPTEQAKQ